MQHLKFGIYLCLIWFQNKTKMAYEVVYKKEK